MQELFYLDPLNNREDVDPTPDPSCVAGDTSLKCAPKKLEFVDVSTDSSRDFFLRIARLTADNSANITPFISDLIPIEVFRDGVNGFYHVSIDTLTIPDSLSEIDGLPGAGKYAFDVILKAGTTEGVGLDYNNFPTFQADDTIFACFDGVFDVNGDPVFAASCPENISGYRQVVGDTKATGVITFLEDAE